MCGKVDGPVSNGPLEVEGICDDAEFQILCTNLDVERAKKTLWRKARWGAGLCVQGSYNPLIREFVNPLNEEQENASPS